MPKDDHPHEMMTVAEIVAKSSNRGAAHLGMLLGEKRLHDYAASFGFGRRTGLGLGGEVNGLLHPVKNWDGLTITRMPMGHAIAATPMQVHAAMATIANGGLLMRPQVVRRLEGPEGQSLEYWPDIERRVIGEDTARTMAQLLKNAASANGTAPRAAIPGFEVAGKTGTTQKIVDGHYSNQHHVGSFVGFFPASDPRVVISVVINDARLNGTAYGSTVAAPSFKSIAERLIQYLGIPPTQPAEPGTAVAGVAPPRNISRDRLR
jgi:cell division protein FtsI/penicillin-binding protein 2